MQWTHYKENIKIKKMAKITRLSGLHFLHICQSLYFLHVSNRLFSLLVWLSQPEVPHCTQPTWNGAATSFHRCQRLRLHTLQSVIPLTLQKASRSLYSSSLHCRWSGVKERKITKQAPPHWLLYNRWRRGTSKTVCYCSYHGDQAATIKIT